ncbi:Eco57I restriction-modification methylase domain-containing protein [Herpetosiphon sp. NSE202]|uniref:Eco57I restriction-modification methylase domain-containing protein n=1 Tax=Herpetosiphon sp. NSE202 TaxID=3351349 RepID=UPI0036395BEB
MKYTAIITEGGLLPADMLQTIAEGEQGGSIGQRPEDFGLPRGRRMSDDIAAAWGQVRAQWQIFQASIERRPNDSLTTLTRRYWVEPFLQLIGYEPTSTKSARRVDNRTYAISHSADDNEDSPPIHIEGINTDIDRRPESGRPRISPHALMQEYLNATEHAWGIVTNGRRLRLLRDSSQTTRPSFVEFDLESLVTGQLFNEFALLYRVLHRTRLPLTSADTAKSLLEHYHQQAREAGGRVREGLREGVETALKVLGRGLLSHPRNADLRDRFANNQLTPLEYYRQLLKLVYRLLFLMVAEDRGLIEAEIASDPLSELAQRGTPQERLKLYYDHYSVGRLRRMAELRGAGRGPYDDVWIALQQTFRIFEGTDLKASKLGIAPLDGDLFGEGAIGALETARLRNADLLAALRALSIYRDPQSNSLRRVNYAALDVEELGSVYESLLDYRPVVNAARFDLVAGTERKTTGSYYTRPELVQELIKSALEPVITERLRAKNPEQALLSITVCDPACGSGHFLLAAARRIARELARVRSGEDQPTPDQFRHAVRDVITHCIYGVDFNPLAVDLCKLALWIEGHCAGMPLSFIDAHIRWGNSLVGATEELMRLEPRASDTAEDRASLGIPDDAFKAVAGDDKAIVAALRKRNKRERDDILNGQTTMDIALSPSNLTNLSQIARQLEALPDDSVAAVRIKASGYARMREDLRPTWTRYNLWTAAFFLPMTKENLAFIPTNATLYAAKHAPQSVSAGLLARVDGLADQAEMRFFHWELEFPHIFGNNSPKGFDVILGNPPWERIKLQEQEHWVDVAEVREAANKAAREKVLKEWASSDEPSKQQRYAKFELAKYTAEATSRFMRVSKRYPLTGLGDVNTYALFTELDRNLINEHGYAGVIVQSGIANDDTNKLFFADIVKKRQLVSLYDFVNTEGVFPGIHRTHPHFCALTMTQNQNSLPIKLAFYLTRPEHLNDKRRLFTLSTRDFELINPNTRTCPTFRTKADAELTKKIYQRIPILKEESLNESHWNIHFATMFHMSNDSGLFQNFGSNSYLPLYEAKFIYQFTHRWASMNDTETIEIEDLSNPNIFINPRYWISNKEVEKWKKNRWNKNWLLGFRNITNATNERTSIFTVLPHSGVGHSMPTLIPDGATSISLVTILLSILNSIALDYIVRQKIGGTNLTFGYLYQLPVLPPERFGEAELAFIVPRVLELVYTAWDMQPFAEDVWAELDELARQTILAQNAECNQGAPAAWFSPRDGFGLPPFRWSDERRAVLRAELDARIARLYGLTRDELRYILDPADVYGREFPGETFRVLKEKETKLYGEYRTRRLVLEAWDREE